PNKPTDLVAIGRLCIDLNANEIYRPMEETRTFTKYVGGSPANIAIGASRLGLRTGFIGKVSDDQMGRYITNYLNENDIDLSGVVTDKSGAVTGLTFTEIKSPTDCNILMYRDHVADLKLSPEEVSETVIRDSKALLVSGTALAKSPSREAVLTALEYARKHGTVVFFDVDYRPYSWASRAETSVYYKLAAEKSDVIIGTREEFDMMENGGDKGNDEVTARKWFDYQAEIVVIKHGEDGSFAYAKDGGKHQGNTFPAEIVKTFGAGDAYASSFIYGLMNGWNIDKAMEYGSASAAIVISSHSCSEAMPTAKYIDAFIENEKIEQEEGR
ncbi:MAG TPA: 5-dehydro-2-deoxygluconokinase, partial [Bacillales bacterium]|nr:5-dehydro-2-deoxygluconokinase [Bacillales bacterium]